MEKVLTYSLSENIIARLSELVYSLSSDKTNFGRIACIFGGHRPALFLRKNLGEMVKKSFIPPRCFSMDEFVDYIVSQEDIFYSSDELDICYMVYNLLPYYLPSLMNNRDVSFSRLLPWIREIIGFIEQLDLNDVSDEKINNLEKSAQIGYDVPDSINQLLYNINNLRKQYHTILRKRNVLTRGMRYRLASEKISDFSLDEFEKVIFVNFFFLNPTEQKIIKECLVKGKGICLFQGSQDEWSVLKDNAEFLGEKIISVRRETRFPKIKFYKGPDLHSQVCITREILRNIDKDKSLAIVLPKAESLIPLLEETAVYLDKFNVSMGYPLKSTSLYSLFDILIRVQETRKEGRYYMRDYITLLKHPFIKNLSLEDSSIVTRIIVHKIEDAIVGKYESELGGSLFLSLEEIEDNAAVLRASLNSLVEAGFSFTLDKCKDILVELHNLVIRNWEDVDNFHTFFSRMEEFLDILYKKSPLSKVPFNIKVTEKLFSINEGLQKLSFAHEKFSSHDIWGIFRDRLDRTKVSFVGSPLQGVQILGVFETRSLNFDTVIVLDVNESVLPYLKVYEPLIPREVMVSLGINRLEKEEEIQRYQFMRLILSAQNAYIIYEENREKEKSRFIEELLWQKQREEQRFDVYEEVKGVFNVKISSFVTRSIEKNEDMINFIKQQAFSATKLDDYLLCPLLFFYKYVIGLKENDDLLQEVEARSIGTFIHRVLEKAFSIYLGKKPLFNKEFEKYFFSIAEEEFKNTLQPRMKADSFLLKKIIFTRLRRFLENEKNRDILKIVALEKEETGYIEYRGGHLTFRYVIDRIDEQEENTIMIIDYKTGNVEHFNFKYRHLQNLEMSRESIRNAVKSFQLPLYYHFSLQKFPSYNINAQLYSIRNLEIRSFIHEDRFRDEIYRICIDCLYFILDEIFDLTTPFIATDNEEVCKRCVYQQFC